MSGNATPDPPGAPAHATPEGADAGAAEPAPSAAPGSRGGSPTPRPGQGLWTAERLRIYPTAAIAAWLLAFAFAVSSGDGPSIAFGRLGGDYPAFYSAGRLVAEGRSAELYAWRAQRDAQADLFPGLDEPKFLMFAYPPFVALAYAPLARLPYRWSYVLHTLLGVALLAASAWWIRPMLPRVGAHPLAVFAGFLLFFPLMRSVLGGQNTAFSLAVVAAVWRLQHDGRHLSAGAVAGLLLAKPQFGLPFLGLVALRRRPRAWLGAGLTAGLLFAMGVAVAGSRWPLAWWSHAVGFQETDRSLNAEHAVGVLGFLEACFGPGSAWAPGLAALVTIPLGLVLARLWWRDRDRSGALRFGLASCALVLIAPHAMFYDAGLAAIGLAVWADRAGALAPVLAAWAGAFAEPVSAWVGMSPVFFVLVAVLVALGRRALR